MELPKYHKKRFEFQTASVLHTIQNFLHLQVVIVGNGVVGKSGMIQRVFTRFSKFLLWFKLLPFPARGFISAVNKYNVVNWQKKNINHLIFCIYRWWSWATVRWANQAWSNVTVEAFLQTATRKQLVWTSWKSNWGKMEFCIAKWILRQLFGKMSIIFKLKKNWSKKVGMRMHKSNAWSNKKKNSSKVKQKASKVCT